MADSYRHITRAEMDAMERDGLGRVEFNELGDAVWVPFDRPRERPDMAQLLDFPEFTFAQEEAPAKRHAIGPNPQGLVKGYDPYESGMLNKTKRQKKKDLRALSRWIQKNRTAAHAKG